MLGHSQNLRDRSRMPPHPKTGSVPGFHRPIALFTEKGEYRRMNLDHTLIALADPTRRAILQRLSRVRLA